MENNKINYNGISIEVKEITPELAKDILENHNNLNRNRNKDHVKSLLNNMKQGTWRFNGDTIRFDRGGELIDGQHRLAALVEFGKPLPMIVVKGFDKEAIKTIDQEVKPRNLADLFKMNGVKDATNVSATINRFFAISETNSFISSNRYNNSHGGGTISGNLKCKITIDAKYNEYFANPDLWDNIVLYARRCYKNTRLLRVSDIGGMYAFLYLRMHHSDEEIIGFFDRLCFTQTDVNVINLLRDLLIRDLVSKNPMTSLVKSQYLVKTWNYYIKGKDVKVLSYNKNTEGIIDLI
jgi:hypothetical protein